MEIHTVLSDRALSPKRTRIGNDERSWRLTELMANNNPDLYLHYFYFQAFSDELDVRQGDFESIRSQGDRLVCQLNDHTERKALQKQMDDVSHRLERIQNLVNDRGQQIGERTHYGVVDFDVALKDCYERVDQFKANLREIRNLESIEEGQDSLQVSKNLEN